MSAILSSIADAESQADESEFCGATSYANLVRARATAARAEHAEIVALFTRLSDYMGVLAQQSAEQAASNRGRFDSLADACDFDRKNWMATKKMIDALLYRLGERIETKETEEAKDKAYKERNWVVCALSKVLPSWLGQHSDLDTDWDPEWRTIVFVQLATGQASWHIHDSERWMFDHLSPGGDKWDGHTTDEKHDRIRKMNVLLPTFKAMHDLATSPEIVALRKEWDELRARLGEAVIYRIRMWLWLRKWRRLVNDLYEAREDMNTASETYRLAQDYASLVAWESYRETVEILKRDLDAHALREPKKKGWGKP